MQKRIVSLVAPLVVGIMALALGWFAHGAAPLSAQGIVLDGRAAFSSPAAPAAGKANLTYQGRLTNSAGAPINATVNITFTLYDDIAVPLWTSTTRSITPTNGLFTVYLGSGADPALPFDTLAKAASIGVTVGGEEMTPHQALRSVVGHSLNEVGVVGSSVQGFGVFGSSDTLPGVKGSSNTGDGVSGASSSGDGVVGQTYDVTRAGVLARGADNSGIALEISSGGIKATGAGLGTNTFAFLHKSTITNTVGFDTQIDNALTNGDPAAMLFVTHVFNPTGVTNYNKAFGVYYSFSDYKWTIYEEDGQPFPANVTFNVMVIKR
jgi:hypothetical protein